MIKDCPVVQPFPYDQLIYTLTKDNLISEINYWKERFYEEAGNNRRRDNNIPKR